MMKLLPLQALFLGSLWCFSFAPWNLPFLQILSLAGVLFLLQTQAQSHSWRMAVKQSAYLGWCYGLGQFLGGVHWLYISLHDVAQMPAFMAVIAVFALSAYLALFPALVMACWVGFCWWIYQRLRYAFVMLAGAFASIWTLAEYLRAVVFTGFPWLTAGDAWIDNPLSALYPILGTYGVSFVVAWVSGFVSAFVFFLLKSACILKIRQGVNQKRVLYQSCLAVFFSLILGCVVYLGLRQLEAADWSTQSLQTVKVQLVQPNVSQLLKFDPEHIQNNVLTSLLLGEQAVTKAERGQWLVFPETALPVLWQEAPWAWRQAFFALAEKKQMPVVLGAAFEHQGVYTNSVLLLDSGIQAQTYSSVARYDKRHLVPFGEFIPFGFHWFVQWMNIPLGEFSRGQGAVQPFNLDGVLLLPNICYEDTFSHEMGQLVREAATEPHVLLNVSNLAWFGRSSALEQHAQMSRVRAAELRKPMLRATNTGVSGAIDAWGRWTQRLPEHQAAVGLVQVQARSGLTPYARYGLLGVCALAVLMCLFGFAVCRPHQVQ